MIWHDIPEYPHYEISTDGIIRKRGLVSKGNGKLIVSQTKDRFYLGAKLKHESGVWKRVKIHVIMMRVFVGPRPEGLVINHIDGDKLNNNLNNLEYCTNQENEHHSLTVLNKIHYRGPNGCFVSAPTTTRVV